MAQTPFRWGLLSTARINRSIIPPLQASPRHALVAVASRDRGRGEAYAREWGIPRVHVSYETLIDDPEIDAIYNPLPNALHAAWTIRAVRAGKHVLCEKPLATTVADVDAIASEAKAAGVVVTEAFMYRHHPQTLRLKALVDERAIGRLRLIRSAFTFQLTRSGDVRWEPSLGGGSLEAATCGGSRRSAAAACGTWAATRSASRGCWRAWNPRRCSAAAGRGRPTWTNRSRARLRWAR